jgi:hypothetical protein
MMEEFSNSVKEVLQSWKNLIEKTKVEDYLRTQGIEPITFRQIELLDGEEVDPSNINITIKYNDK